MNEFERKDLTEFFIKTKNKRRKIVTYISDECELKKYHIDIVEFIERSFIPSVFSKGYVKNTSIYDNAVSHLYNDYFVKIDVENFFQNINHKKLANNLFYELNRVKQNQITKNECFSLVNSCSINEKGLPLGLVTSPILSNVYMKDFDNCFYGQLKKLDIENVIYTRYADDILVSFRTNHLENIYEYYSKIISIAKNELKRKSLEINNKKTRCYNIKHTKHVRITGINIVCNENNFRHLSVGRKTKNKLFWDAIDVLETRDYYKRMKVKGMYSFCVSVEKKDFDQVYSAGMKQLVKSKGFNDFEGLIKSL